MTAPAPAPAPAPAAAPKKKGEAPEPLPPRIVYPKKDKEDEPHPRPPPNGVTAQWPTTVLPIVRRDVDTTTKVLPQTTVLPVVRRDVDIGPKVLPTGTVLPIAGRMPDAGGGEGKGSGGTAKDGTADGTGVQKTTYDKIAEQLAFTGAIANLQLNEDLKRPDGKRYGIPGGKNPNGPNSPEAQAAAGVVLIGTAILSANATKFRDKLKAAFEKAAKAKEKVAAMTFKEVEALGEKGAEELAKAYGHIMADALNHNGAIGPYAVMKQFTEKLGGRWQAHHILEKKWAEKFTFGNADKFPSVILTEAEHKTITARLNLATRGIDNVEKLWKAYQEAYADHPEWLEAIKSYFGK